MAIFLYPTDTIYGLGVDATSDEAVRALKELKGRDSNKPISVMVSGAAMLSEYAEVTPLAQKLIDAFLPGKLTLVLKAKPGLSKEISQDGSIGIRIPNHEASLALVARLGVPVTATSANVSGMQPEKTPEAILAQFGDSASMISEVIDGGELSFSEPSTIVDAQGSEPVILRQGAITNDAILKVSAQ